MRTKLLDVWQVKHLRGGGEEYTKVADAPNLEAAWNAGEANGAGRYEVWDADGSMRMAFSIPIEPSNLAAVA